MTGTLEQQRAAYAYQFVFQFTGKKSELATHIKKTPIRILQNGLGQALAFLLSNNEGKTGIDRKASGNLYDHLQGWLCGTRSDQQPCRVYCSDAPNLMKQLIEGNRTQYMEAQDELLRLFTWLKKFADAFLTD